MIKTLMMTSTSSNHAEGHEEREFLDAQETMQDVENAQQEEQQSLPSESSSWRRLLFPFSSPAAAAAREQANNSPTPTPAAASHSNSQSLHTTPLRDNSLSRSESKRSPPETQEFIVWNSTPAPDESTTIGESLSTPLLQFTPSQQLLFHSDVLNDDADNNQNHNQLLDHDADGVDLLAPPPTSLRRQRSSWSRRSNRRPTLNGLNWLNVLAFSLHAAVFVWTTVVYWQKHYHQDSDDNHHAPIQKQRLPLLTPASWYFWYATKFPMIGLQAAFCLAQLLPMYRNRSVIQSGRDGGVGVSFAQVCVLQLVATICWSLTMNMQLVHMESQQSVMNEFTVDDLLDDVSEQPDLEQIVQHPWGWRALMLVQTTATALTLMVMAALWMRRSSSSIMASSSGSSFCGIVRRVVDHVALELPFSWLLGACCVELVHLLAVLVLQWETPFEPRFYGAWPRAMDYTGLAWLLPVALLCLLGWRPGAGSASGESPDDHVMNAILMQQSSSAASPTPAWRPDFCVPAVILVAYVSISTRLEELQRLKLEGDEDAASAIHFYGGTDVVESFVIVSFVLTGTVGVVWILALIVWLSRQFCTIRVVQVVLEDDY
ncbi:hypothetical protein MPSEU_000988000 [Mayamaea pseudoterrestris]|nr:hypothetical protein MPSEU_000988000 [Mayamaea pseudoterrestris]